MKYWEERRRRSFAKSPELLLCVR